jgi:YbbR domain-containing protein
MRTVWPFRHFGLKLISIGLAIVLWLVVSGEEVVERSLRVSLELEQFPSGLELQNEAPSGVDVRVRGQSSALASLSNADLVAVLDLEDAGPGRRLYHLTPEQVRAPYDVQVVQVAPSTVNLVFERTLSRSVPVQPSIEGRPAPGHAVGRVTSVPAEVEIVGPSSAVARAEQALTETIDVEGATATVRRTVKLGLADPQLRLRSGQATAVVTVEIQETNANP